jgi:hypothetical protein
MFLIGQPQNTGLKMTSSNGATGLTIFFVAFGVSERVGQDVDNDPNFAS